MTIAEFYKKVDTSVAVAKIVFNYLSEHSAVKQINQIAETSSGGTPTRSNPEYYSGTIPWLKSGELNDGLITDCEEFITDNGLKNSSAKLFPKGTLLVAMYGATAGKTGVVNFDAATNQAVCAVFPNKGVERDYLFWYFRQQRFDFIEISRGGAQPNISQTVINNADIPVPDLAVQKQVVGFLTILEEEQRIDNRLVLNAEVAQNIARYFKIRTEAVEVENIYFDQQTLLAQLRQAILEEAVQGKLTEKWRAESEVLESTETGGVLLARIRAEKTELIRQGKLRKEKPLPPITDAEKPFELPKDWVWCRLGDICTKIGSGSTPSGSNYVESGFPFFRSQNIYNDCLVYEDITFISSSIHGKMNGTIVYANDLLLNITGGSLGRCALVPQDFKEGNVSQHVCIIRPLIVESSFLHKLILSPYFQKLVFNSTTGAGREGLPKYNLEQFVIPLPPIAEQQAIVAQVEQLLNQVSALETENKQQQAEVGRLMQAVLREAFAGKTKEVAIEA